MINLPNMAQDITFEESGHVYKMGNMIIPSVTQLMKPIYSFDGINANVLLYAAERGTAVHFAIEKFIKYGYISKLDSEAQQYFEQFINWFNENHFIRDDFLCEIPGYNKTYNFCGCMDLIYQDKKGDLHLCDIKTCAVADIEVWSVQQSAYDMIAKSYGINIKHKEVLQLSQTDYKLFQCSDQIGAFMYCMGIYNFLKNKK